jgi:hypothetical protein
MIQKLRNFIFHEMYFFPKNEPFFKTIKEKYSEFMLSYLMILIKKKERKCV